MNSDRWWGFVNGLRQVGVERIAGDVVIDNSLFAPQVTIGRRSTTALTAPTTCCPTPLMVNFQTVNVTVVPDAAAGAVRARINPWPANLTVEKLRPARAGTLPARCRWRRRCDARGPFRQRVERWRPLRVRLRTDVDHARGDAAPEFAFGTFKTFWQQSGGTLDGGLRMGPGAGGREIALHARVADAR